MLHYYFNIALVHVTLDECFILPLSQVVLTVTSSCENGQFLQVQYYTITLLMTLIVAYAHAVSLLSNYRTM